MPTRYIDLLHSGTQGMFNQEVKALKGALPSDVQIVERYANDDIGQLEDYADDLVGSVLAIVAAGGPPSAIAAMNATETQPGAKTPVVFTTVADPVASGLVDSLPTPGRNLTGMAGQTSELDPKRLELLKEFVSATTGAKIGVLINPDRDHHVQQYAALKNKAVALSLDLKPRRTNNVNGIKRVFKDFKRKQVLGVVVTADSFFYNNRDKVVQAAESEGVPTIYQWSEFAEAGGLISYGPSIREAYEKAGQYVTDILDNGASPATMPCSKPDPSLFELVVNKAAALNLGFKVIPPMIGGIPVTVI
jgi:putative tryptophan/tyrosine transport system substrate-binding protein